MPGRIRTKNCVDCAVEFQGYPASQRCAQCARTRTAERERLRQLERTGGGVYSRVPCECGNHKRMFAPMCDACEELPKGVADVRGIQSR